MPDHKLVSSGRNGTQDKSAVVARERAPLIWSNDDGRRHIGMKMTEDLDDSGPVKLQPATLPGRIVTQVKGLRLRKRKYVVENRVGIGKGDS